MNSSDQHDVLLDLSMATLGFSGIPYDTRLLFRNLSKMNTVNVTGLIFSQTDSVVLEDVSHDRDKQSLYLKSLAAHTIDWSGNRIFTLLKKGKYFSKLLLKQKFELKKIDNDRFGEFLWRELFQQTLTNDDKPIVEAGDFVHTDISFRHFAARNRLGLPQPSINTKEFDYFITQTSKPFNISESTKMLTRFHDLIPLKHPDWVDKPKNIKNMSNLLPESLQRSHFVCNSKATENSLLNNYPEAEGKTSTIPYTLSSKYYPDKNREDFSRIIDVRRSSKIHDHSDTTVEEDRRFLLTVCTLEPRKNHVRLLNAYQKLRTNYDEDLFLIVVGSLGWNYDRITSAMEPLLERGELIHLEAVPTHELRVVFSEASCFMFPSLDEGFGIPPMEAMKCETPSVVSDIPAHRWVMEDAVFYCDPYDVESIYETTRTALEETDPISNELRKKMDQQVQRYNYENTSKQWEQLFQQLSQQES